jgi:hypothetical protein
VKVLAVIIIVLILLVAVALVTGIGGPHGPDRHIPSGSDSDALPVTVTAAVILVSDNFDGHRRLDGHPG